MTAEVTVGLLGAGLIAGVHAHAYRACPGVRLVAVADPVPGKAERLAGQHDAKAVGDLDDLLATGVDVVDVCTPPTAHADATIAALGAERHVLCEKPITRTMDDARRVLAAAEAAPGLLSIGQVARYAPDHRLARDLVRAGEIGELRMVTHSTTSSLPGWSEAGWLTDPATSGGPLLDQAVHGFDYARWVIGSPAVRVHCMAADSGAGPATYTLSTVRYESGAIAHVECSWAHPASRGFKLRAELVGTGGRLSWDNDHQMAGVLHAREGDPEWWDALGDREFTRELGAFFDACRAGGPPPVPAVEATESLRMALAALESARSGRTVDLTTWEVS
ncbi:Gfo/Idh/MocA family oxidoreductase [Nocardioides sp. YIM 152315]|uniref:Gfo/Idh/MocA family protein n=1 Tax=Nocardioides sp. YIM 152315 TaxID=3031760 RepID=UPI0023DC89DE|nr:Gfo/Idh/MocA family oxidoreductase [Nocardioides sp. YIM 152315]MDF1605419.1 Gfo/Idh/MocA family oxidoreductase [Nocardioides sp. YIM 152315]